MSVSNPAYCITVRFPQIIGETLVQQVVDSTLHFNESVIKVESIDVTLKYVDWEIVNGKVIFHGKLHKQILYVTHTHYVKEKHEDVTFSGFAVIPGALAGMTAHVEIKVHGVDFSLEQHARLEQHILIDVTVQVTQSIEVCIPVLGQITGQVVLGGVAQANAIVVLYDPNMVMIAFTFTNANGYYRFVNVPPGAYTVVAAVPGTYEARTATITVENAATPVVVNFFMSPTTTCTNILSSAACDFINGMLNVV